SLPLLRRLDPERVEDLARRHRSVLQARGETAQQLVDELAADALGRGALGVGQALLAGERRLADVEHAVEERLDRRLGVEVAAAVAAPTTSASAARRATSASGATSPPKRATSAAARAGVRLATTSRPVVFERSAVSAVATVSPAPIVSTEHADGSRKTRLASP